MRQQRVFLYACFTLVVGLTQIARAQEIRHYRLSWSIPSKEPVMVVVPPLNLPYQSVVIIAGEKSQTQRISGNDFLTITPEKGVASLQLEVERRPYNLKEDLLKATADPPPHEVEEYLVGTYLIKISHRLIKEGVASLPSTTLAWQRAIDISRWLGQHLSYSEDGGNSRSVIQTLNQGYANSRESSEVFCALARASKIPARVIWTLSLEPRKRAKNWMMAEFYQSGVGWIPIDPFHPETMGNLPINTLRMCHYNDITADAWDNQSLHPQKDKLDFQEISSK